jgi:signal transduction histidine kinase
VLAFAAVIWAVYRMRLRHVASRLKLRFEERLTERLRIAGDLHDTLLQELLSASMHLYVAADILPHNSPVKGKLEHVLRLMSKAAENGRNTVHGLRSRDAGSLRLDHAFARIKQEFDGGKDEGPELHVFVQGRPRPLQPAFQDEVYCIGREALINAFRHAGAKNIEVELEYSDRRFKLAVCDDGRGIEQGVLQTGRAGHWGLTGMRERAQRIGAQLHVSTRLFGGTQVKISALGNLAFSGEPESSDAVMSGLGLRRRVLRFLRLITRTG